MPFAACPLTHGIHTRRGRCQLKRGFLPANCVLARTELNAISDSFNDVADCQNQPGCFQQGLQLVQNASHTPREPARGFDYIVHVVAHSHAEQPDGRKAAQSANPNAKEGRKAPHQQKA